MDAVPGVSIIVPSFNQGQYLEQCLGSLFSQNYPKLEVLVYDGGSTDNSMQVIGQYANRLTYWQSEPDGGQTCAINLGFRRATGKYVGWLNSDDYLLSGALEATVSALERRPDVAMVSGALQIIDGNGVQLSVRGTGGDLSLNSLLNKNRSLNQPGSLFRSSVAESVGYLDETYNYAMDYDFWVRIARSHPILTIPFTVAAYRMHKESKTASNYMRFLPEISAIRHQNHARVLCEKSVSMFRVRLGYLRSKFIGN